ncbi:MAG: PAS domain-containing protein [Gammaproteobacteria bacterium]|nr:PAS domain-containing protein [Gammaproteobacteria bacterium]
MQTAGDNSLRSRVTFVEVKPERVQRVSAKATPRLEVLTLDSVEQLLTASSLGTLDCEVVVLGVALKEPVRVAQHIQKLDRNIQIIILAESDQAESYRRQIEFSPFLADAVKLLSVDNIEQLEDVIGRSVNRAHRRCSYSRRLEAPKSAGGAGQAWDASQYLDSVLDNAPIGMLTLDANGRIQTLNRRGSEILNVSERDVLDTPFKNFFMPVDRIRLDRALNDNETYVGHFRIGGDSEHPHFVEITASEYVARSGQPGNLIILHDVTDRVTAERARTRAATALQASEDRFHDLAEVLRLIPWEGDASTHQLTFVGELAEEFTGYPQSAWYEEDFWSQKLVHPDDRKKAMKTRRNNSRRLQNFDHEYRIVTTDERVLWVHDIVNVVRDENAKPSKLRGFMVDVTEKKERKLQKKAAAERIAGHDDGGA